jgi:hypothetical protein
MYLNILYILSIPAHGGFGGHQTCQQGQVQALGLLWREDQVYYTIHINRSYWFSYLQLAEDYPSLMFLINILNFIIEEYSYFTLEGDMYYDQELAHLAA